MELNKIQQAESIQIEIDRSIMPFQQFENIGNDKYVLTQENGSRDIIEVYPGYYTALDIVNHIKDMKDPYRIFLK